MFSPPFFYSLALMYIFRMTGVGASVLSHSVSCVYSILMFFFRTTQDTSALFLSHCRCAFRNKTEGKVHCLLSYLTLTSVFFPRTTGVCPSVNVYKVVSSIGRCVWRSGNMLRQSCR